MANPETNERGFPTMTILNDPLNDTNWVVWSEAMRCVLRLGGVEEHAFGKIKRPENAHDAEKWDHNDVLAQLIIMNNISNPEMIHLSRCETANAMWLSLEAIHDPESTRHRLSFDALGRSLFHTAAEDGADFDEHLIKLRVYWERFNSMTGDDLQISDAFFKIIVAASLPPSWDTFTEPYIGIGCSEKKGAGPDPRKLMESQQFVCAIKREERLLREARTLRDESARQAATFRRRSANRMAAATNAGSGTHHKRRGRRNHDT